MTDEHGHVAVDVSVAVHVRRNFEGPLRSSPSVDVSVHVRGDSSVRCGASLGCS
jgi:hypothetical protein